MARRASDWFQETIQKLRDWSREWLPRNTPADTCKQVPAIIMCKHLSSAAVRSQQYIVIDILLLVPYAALYRSMKHLPVQPSEVNTYDSYRYLVC